MKPITIQLDPGFALQADIIGDFAQKLRKGGVPLEPKITSGIASFDAPWLSRRLGELGYTWRTDKRPDGSVRIEVWKEDK